MTNPPRTASIADLEAERDAPRADRRRFAGLRRVIGSRQTRWGLLLLAFMLAFAFLGPLFAPYEDGEVVTTPFAPIGAGWPFGSDLLGRDILSRVLFGGFNLSWMAVLSATFGVALGTVVGLLGAYFPGAVDTVLMRTVEVLLVFPGIILALLFISMVGPSPWALVVLVAIGHTPGVARVMRGAAHPIIEREFVQWARAAGAPARYVLGREVLPNIVSPLMVELGLCLMWSVGALAGLSFLGYGIQPPAADWGLMVSENRGGLTVQPLVVLVPALCIALFTIGGNLFAEGVARVIGRTEGKA